MPDVKEIIELMGGELNAEGVELIKKAYKFSEELHRGQKRLSGEPYFHHVFETAKTLANLGMDVETVAGGLLHDVLEDTRATEEDLEKNFGPSILFLVNGVTNLRALKYRGRERYVESLRKFFFAMSSDLRVVIIKFADRLHNLQTLGVHREDKKRRIAIESIEVYASLANRLGMGKLKGQIEDAAFPHAYPKEHTQIEEIIKEKRGPYLKYLAEIKQKLEEELKKNKIKVFEIDYRMKHKYSLWKKFLKREKDFSKVYDFIALRVIVDSVEECYRTLGIIHSLWNPLPGRIKDYIALPKPNGYRSIHTTVFTGSGETAEIQIRTKKMHKEAEYGIAAHFAYKENSEGKNSADKLKLKWIEELKGLNYSNDNPKNFLEHLKADFFSDRIFVFTPEGDVVDLPEDSSPIDFAYSIHSDIGDHISGAKINDKMSPIFSELKNKDIIKIITKKESHPTAKWLEHVKTTLAKRHIRSYLEKNSLFGKLRSFRRS